MSFGKYGGRTYHYDSLSMLHRKINSGFKLEEYPDVIVRTDNTIPLRYMQLEASKEALLVRVREKKTDRYVDTNGETTNCIVFPKSVGLLSVEYDDASGLNHFMSTELLLANPDFLSSRALGCLSIIHLHMDELQNIADQALKVLLDQTSADL